MKFFLEKMKQKKETVRQGHGKQGFAMLFAVLIISVILAIAMSVADIGYKELLLSSVSRDSQYAFYSADAGLECALYLDFNQHIFASGATVPSSVKCFNQTVAISQPLTNEFRLKTATTSTNKTQQCFNVVTVIIDTSTGNTDIKSSGQNVCDSSNPRQVERGLEVEYINPNNYVAPAAS